MLFRSMVKATVTTATGDTLKSFLSAKSPVGAQVKITGVSLTETTGVKFGAVAATEFEVGFRQGGNGDRADRRNHGSY